MDVLAYNSKVYYVIYDGGGYGQQVYKLPIVGGETVLDAISQLTACRPSSSTKRIWVARPAPDDAGCRQMLPVDWAAITEGGCDEHQLPDLPRRPHLRQGRLPGWPSTTAVEGAGAVRADARLHAAGQRDHPRGGRPERRHRRGRVLTAGAAGLPARPPVGRWYRPAKRGNDERRIETTVTSGAV